MVCDLAGIFHITTRRLSVLLKATTEGAKRTAEESGRDGGHERGVNTTGKQKG
jgi:hypothetical protein